MSIDPRVKNGSRRVLKTGVGSADWGATGCYTCSWGTFDLGGAGWRLPRDTCVRCGTPDAAGRDGTPCRGSGPQTSHLPCTPPSRLPPCCRSLSGHVQYACLSFSIMHSNRGPLILLPACLRAALIKISNYARKAVGGKKGGGKGPAIPIFARVPVLLPAASV